MDDLRVVIVVPTLGRPQKLERLLKTIPETAEYSNYRVLIKQDQFGSENKGVPKLVAEAVAESPDADAFMYLANDVIPQPGFLRIAVESMQRWFPECDGLVGANDMYWHGEMFTHFLIGRKLIEALGGEIFHVGYSHIACDCELTERARMMNKAVWCEEFKVYHDHPIQTGMRPEDMDEVYRLAYDPERNAKDRELWIKRSQELGFPIRQNFRYPRIPRRAFSFWLGERRMPELVERCIASQKRFTLGWDYTLYTLENIPRGIPYVEAAIASKRWVKAVDFLRVFLLHRDGGVYFDADVELLKPFPDEMRTDRMFAGRERLGWIGNGVVGAEPGHPVLAEILKTVEQNFCGDDERNFESSVQVLTETAHNMGLEKYGIKVYPPPVFTPYDHQGKKEEFTEDTVAYHHFIVTWGYPSIHPCIDLRPRLGELDDKKVLNIGLGTCESGLGIQLVAYPIGQLDHVEIHPPYIEGAKRRFWVAKQVNFYQRDVRDLTVEDYRQYDCVLCADVLEHLEKADALMVIERIQEANTRLVVFGPMEKELQNLRDGVDMGVESQAHLSLWAENDFISLGFSTEVIHDFHRESAGVWDAVWAIWESVRESDMEREG